MSEIRVAGIGSRRSPKYVLDWMEEMGGELVKHGHTLVSGNAEGCDQAWARGANKIAPTKVELWLAFRTKNSAIVPGNKVHVFVDLPEEEQAKYVDIVRGLHPAWQHVNDNAAKLLGRNAKIVEGSAVVIGHTESMERGGTMMGYKLAKKMCLPYFNVEGVALRKQLLDMARSGEEFWKLA